MPDKYLITEEGGSVVATGSFAELFPGVKPAADGPDADFLASRRAHLLHGAPAYDPETHYPVPADPYRDGETWRNETLEAWTPAEVAARAAAALASAAASALADLDLMFRGKRDGGLDLDVDGQGTIVRFATDAAAYQELDALVRRLGRKGGTQKARTRSGAVIEPDLATATAVFEAVDDHIAACWAREAELAAAIGAATSKAEIDAIDISSGWPG